MIDEADVAQAIDQVARERAIEASRRTVRGAGTAACEDCGAAIGAARRRAMPSARRCVRCQSQIEGREWT